MSDLAIEVSAVRGFGDPDGVTTCNDELALAYGFGVYIRNPLAFHIQDFGTETESERVTIREAHIAAFRYAGALAGHLGCDVVTSLPVGPYSWPSRFVVEAQRDALDVGPLVEPAGETHFIACEEERATQWALLKLDVAPCGAPVPHTGDLVEDYPTRAAAEAARDALERGQPLPDPIWPEPIGVDVTAERLALAGFSIEGGGAGAAFMSRTVAHPASASRAAIIIATDRDGGDLPRADSWLFGVYWAAEWEEGQEPIATMANVPGAVIEESANAAAAMARVIVFGGAR